MENALATEDAADAAGEAVTLLGCTPNENFAEGVPKLICDLMPKSAGFFSALSPSLDWPQHGQLATELSFLVMQPLHSHLAVCWDTIFLNTSSTGAIVSPFGGFAGAVPLPNVT